MYAHRGCCRLSHPSPSRAPPCGLQCESALGTRDCAVALTCMAGWGRTTTRVVVVVVGRRRADNLTQVGVGLSGIVRMRVGAGTTRG